MKVKISSIKINPGRREAEPKAIEELARSISAVGLMNPITLDQNNTLVAGLHRLEAAKLLGWTEIECNIIGMSSLQAELAEIDENIVRTSLSWQELGDQLLRRKELYEAIHPETRQGQRNGQTAKNDNLTVLQAKPFSEDTADKLGISKRTVERLVQTAANLTPEAKKIIQDSGTKITKGAALKISRLPPDQQAEAAAVLTIAPPAKKKPDTADLESLLKEFKAHAQRFISGMTAFDRQAETFARMSYVQSNELWNSAVAVTDVIRAFSKKVNHIKDELQGDHSHEN